MKRLPGLVRVLRDPSAVRDLDAAGWDLLLRQADVANLDALLLVRLEDAGLLDTVPAAPRTHLEWTRVGAASHARAARYEVRQIGRALAGEWIAASVSRISINLSVAPATVCKVPMISDRVVSALLAMKA